MILALPAEGPRHRKADHDPWPGRPGALLRPAPSEPDLRVSVHRLKQAPRARWRAEVLGGCCSVRSAGGSVRAGGGV